MLVENHMIESDVGSSESESLTHPTLNTAFLVLTVLGVTNTTSTCI